MRTTIDVDPKLLKEVAEATGEKSLSKAVSRALEAYLRRARRDKLLASMGSWDLDLEDWYEFRHQERT